MTIKIPEELGERINRQIEVVRAHEAEWQRKEEEQRQRNLQFEIEEAIELLETHGYAVYKK